MDTATGPAAEARSVQIGVDADTLQGELAIPTTPRGIVLFVHGRGSNRHSPRNRFVAEQLQAGGFATLLLDLLIGEDRPEEDDRPAEEDAAEPAVDVDLLGQRAIAAIDWLSQEPSTSGLALGCFASGTGTAAALVAAAERPERIGALVSRGGYPDLAGLALSRVKAPTLLIVGGSDYPVMSLNRDALQVMSCERSLEVVPGATHLFEENGALDHVARLASDWFLRYLVPVQSSQ